MLKEIQTARLSEERKGGHSGGRGGPNGGKGSSLDQIQYEYNTRPKFNMISVDDLTDIKQRRAFLPVCTFAWNSCPSELHTLGSVEFLPQTRSFSSCLGLD